MLRVAFRHLLQVSGRHRLPQGALCILLPGTWFLRRLKRKQGQAHTESSLRPLARRPASCSTSLDSPKPCAGRYDSTPCARSGLCSCPAGGRRMHSSWRRPRSPPLHGPLTSRAKGLMGPWAPLTATIHEKIPSSNGGYRPKMGVRVANGRLTA